MDTTLAPAPPFLDTDSRLSPAGAAVYEKCRDCHLFIEENDTGGDPEIAPFVHLYGSCDACAETDASHAATPGGGHATLAWWKANGPALMRARFEG